MKKTSLTKVLSLALGCAALIFGSQAASAREFSAFAGTTFILVPMANTAPLQFTHTVDGVADVSPLGHCTVHFDLIVTSTTDPKRPYNVEGTQTLTTADGKSSVTSSVKGFLSSDPANGTFLGIQYKLSFICGTGALAQAKGNTQLRGFAALAVQPGYVDLPGTPNVYPVDADLMLPGTGNLTGKACWVMNGNLKLNGGDCDEDDDL